jgi:SAM-dependent methyltransferase
VFTRSSAHYDAMYDMKDYAAAGERVHELIAEHAPGARRLLDVGCGTGRHLAHLSARYEVEGLDLDPGMVALARDRLPGVPVHQADMAEFRLPRRFDVVTCLFSSIAYVRSHDRMAGAVARMAEHLAPGGLLIVEPWFTPETFWTDTITANFVDRRELKIAWMYTSRREDLVSVLDIHFMVGTPEGVERFGERHELGLFTHDEYLDAFRAAGLEPWHDPEGLFSRGLYLGLRPKQGS